MSSTCRRSIGSILSDILLYLIIFFLVSGCASKPLREQTNQHIPTRAFSDKESSAQRLRRSAAELAQEIRSSLALDQKRTMAIIPLTDIHGNTTELGLYLAEKITTELSAGEGKLDLLERSRIAEVITEFELNMSGLMDESKIREAGKALGADFIVVGSLAALGAEIDINLRVIEIESFEVVGKASRLLPDDPVIMDMMKTVRKESHAGSDLPRTTTMGHAGNIVFYDDFHPSQGIYTFDHERNPRRQGKYSFNDEVGYLEIANGDNISLRLNFTLPQVMSEGKIIVEFTPLRVYPYSGAISLEVTSSKKNGYHFTYPASYYTARIGSVISDQFVLLQESGGHNFELNKPHTIELHFTPETIQCIFDGRGIFSINNQFDFPFEHVRVGTSQLDCFIQSITVEGV